MIREPTVATRLARFALGLRFDAIAEEALARAKLHILDSLGIGLASSTFDFGRRTVDALAALAGAGPYPVLGMQTDLPLRDALLANGTLIHGLDFDDTHSGAVVHTSTSAVPIALWAGRHHAATGREALAAYLVAVESASRIGQAAQGGFHQRGFHPTGLVGIFGATLAAGRLAGLDEQQLAHAQGIALSMASGSLEFLEDGAWTKRMHPGWAAAAAVTACALARGGFTGPSRPYEGRFGLFSSYLGAQSAGQASACAAGLGESWEMLNVALKPYPACHYNHAFIDAALELRRRYGFAAEDVQSVQALIGAQQVAVVCEPEADKRRPANSYQAQFSVHYAIAAALVHGRFTLDELGEEALREARVLRLMDCTGYAADPHTAFPRYYSGEVVLRLRDGRELRHREAVNRGAAPRPLSPDAVVAKFRANASRALGDKAQQRVIDEVQALDERASLEALLSAIRP